MCAKLSTYGKLDRLKVTLWEWEGTCTAGYINPKVVEWVMLNTDSRGRNVLKLVTRLSLSVINVEHVSSLEDLAMQR